MREQGAPTRPDTRDRTQARGLRRALGAPRPLRTPHSGDWRLLFREGEGAAGTALPTDAGGPGPPPSPAEHTPEQGSGPRPPAPRRVPGLQVPCPKGERTGQESRHHKADPDRQTAGPCREPAAQGEGSQPAEPSQREGRRSAAKARLGAWSGNRSTCHDDDLVQPDK